MATINRRLINKNTNKSKKTLTKNVYNYLNSLKTKYLTLDLIFSPKLSVPVMTALFVFEVILNIFIINGVKYTEIDWSTYMEQVQSFINGTINYQLISGSTGPIVYPGGHLYVYTLLYYLTNRGQHILSAQYIFALIYLITLIAVFRIYHKINSKLPPYALVFMCCTSYRIHSIYVLRLFNDTIAMAFLYIAVNFFIDRKWTVGSLFYSLAVSIKMNILLFAPAVLLILLETNDKFNVIKNLTVCALVQVLIGLPFLVTHPKEYMIRSFNFGRIFLHKWTVNWRFIPNNVFVSHYFHITLLALHLITILFFFKKRCLNYDKWFPTIRSISRTLLSNDQILLTLFTANLIGITFSRSLHYQFYVWYFHSLPFLLWNTSYAPKTKLCVMGIIELSWNTYPSTKLSSAILHFAHLIILFGLYKNNSNSDIQSIKTLKSS